MASLEKDKAMGAQLSEISGELAAGLLREVGFEDRFTGWRMRQMSGSQETFLYSLREVLDFMNMPEIVALMSSPSGGSIGYVDIDRLRQWIGEVLGDSALANAIGDAHAGVASYAEAVEPIRKLIEQRLEQCESVFG